TRYSNMAQAIADLPAWAVVASPAPFHLAHASELLAAGIPVLIEKPLADTLSSFTKAADVLIAHQKKIDVAYNLRFMPSAVRFKELLDQKVVGNIHGV